MGNKGYSLASHAKRQARGLQVVLTENPFSFHSSAAFNACRQAASQVGRLYGAVRDNADVFDISQDELDRLHAFAGHAAVRLLATMDALELYPSNRLRESEFADKAAVTLASLADALRQDSVDAMRDKFSAEIKKLHDEIYPPDEQAEPAELSA